MEADGGLAYLCNIRDRGSKEQSGDRQHAHFPKCVDWTEWTQTSAAFGCWCGVSASVMPGLRLASHQSDGVYPFRTTKCEIEISAYVV